MDDIERLSGFISQFTGHEIDEGSIIVMGRNYFLASPELQQLRDRLSRDAFSIGIFLGENKGHFLPSPAFIDMISRMPGSDKKKIYINKKAEWLFLCARNVLQESIVKNPNNLHEGLVLVQNEFDENLGYGIFKQEGKDLVIRNLLDKGKYLRYNEKRRGSSRA